MRRGRLALLAAAAVSALAAAGTSSAAARCSPTPQDGFGPFGRGAPPVRAKVGSGHVLVGQILGAPDCAPLRGAQVQLWQANAKGQYVLRYSATVITDRNGRFRFQGPYPPAYEGAPPHIHLRVFAAGYVALLTRYEPARGAHRGAVRLVLEPEAL